MTRREWLQLGVGLAAIGVVIVASVYRLGPFAAIAPELIAGKEPSLWFFLLSDPLTLGFLRVGLIALAVYAIASIPALVVGGRWIKSFGASGLSADDAREAKESIAQLTTALNNVKRERDIARAALRSAKELLSERG